MCRMCLDASGKVLDFTFPLTDYNFLTRTFDSKRFDRALGIQPGFSVTTKEIATGPESRSLPEAFAATEELLAAIKSNDEGSAKQIIWPQLLPKLMRFLEGVGDKGVHVRHETRGKLWSEVRLDSNARSPHEQDEVLFKAVFDKSPAAAKSAIAKGASPNLTDGSGTSMLARAAADCPKMIGVLIDCGADPNGRFTFRSRMTQTVRTGQVPLMSANSAEAVRILVERGANLDAQDASGNTALMWAARWGTEDVVKALLAAGADKTIRRRETPKRRALTASEIAREELDYYAAAAPKSYKPKLVDQSRARFERILKMLS